MSLEMEMEGRGRGTFGGKSAKASVFLMQRSFEFAIVRQCGVFIVIRKQILIVFVCTVNVQYIDKVHGSFLSFMRKHWTKQSLQKYSFVCVISAAKHLALYPLRRYLQWGKTEQLPEHCTRIPYKFLPLRPRDESFRTMAPRLPTAPSHFHHDLS